jgi:hypothetical protein
VDWRPRRRLGTSAAGRTSGIRVERAARGTSRSARLVAARGTASTAEWPVGSAAGANRTTPWMAGRARRVFRSGGRTRAIPRSVGQLAPTEFQADEPPKLVIRLVGEASPPHVAFRCASSLLIWRARSPD